ncbi:hypothetical protein Fcan01_08324 [Folsomia candida]|uniref:Uncharacterized protein n=1 Tax=Folsomia candida TaxID=158441 RepID=A0A226ELI9_FOLCA|nr:hypothetical protein Fcan01_08324 [Folsomia candida]
MYFNREPKPKENTGSPTSQDDFTKRSYFYGDQDHRLQNQTPSFIRNESSIDDESTRTSSRKRCSKTAWIWVGVIAAYLTAFGIVVAILLLAPKYPSLYYSDTTFPKISQEKENSNFQLVELDQGIPNSNGPEPNYNDQPGAEVSHFYYIPPHSSMTKQFIPSPQVILYDINPRKLDKGQPH